MKKLLIILFLLIGLSASSQIRHNQLKPLTSETSDSVMFLLPDKTFGFGAVESGTGDNWGTDVVNSDITLTGDGTAGNILKVDTSILVTVTQLLDSTENFLTQVDTTATNIVDENWKTYISNHSGSGGSSKWTDDTNGINYQLGNVAIGDTTRSDRLFNSVSETDSKWAGYFNNSTGRGVKIYAGGTTSSTSPALEVTSGGGLDFALHRTGYAAMQSIATAPNAPDFAGEGFLYTDASDGDKLKWRTSTTIYDLTESGGSATVTSVALSSSDFTISGSPITTSGTITANLASASVDAANLNNNVISGKTALTSGLASTDELMISDAGTIKRMDVSVMETYMQDNLNFTTGSTITLSGAVTGSGTTSITTEIESDSVRHYMLNDDIISGHTAMTSGLVSGDELLISNNGFLQRMDVFVLEGYMQNNLDFGSGGLSASGTPAMNQIGVFGSSSTIGGNSDFLWDGDEMFVGTTTDHGNYSMHVGTQTAGDGSMYAEGEVSAPVLVFQEGTLDPSYDSDELGVVAKSDNMLYAKDDTVMTSLGSKQPILVTASNPTLTSLHYTVIANTGVTKIMMPALTGAKNKIYVLVNRTSSSITLRNNGDTANFTYNTFSGTATTIAANSAITIQCYESDSWYQIK